GEEEHELDAMRTSGHMAEQAAEYGQRLQNRNAARTHGLLRLRQPPEHHCLAAPRAKHRVALALTSDRNPSDLPVDVDRVNPDQVGYHGTDQHREHVVRRDLRDHVENDAYLNLLRLDAICGL